MKLPLFETKLYTLKERISCFVKFWKWIIITTGWKWDLILYFIKYFPCGTGKHTKLMTGIYFMCQTWYLLWLEQTRYFSSWLEHTIYFSSNILLSFALYRMMICAAAYCHSGCCHFGMLPFCLECEKNLFSPTREASMLIYCMHC